MKTSELIGPALDWAVAKCEGKARIPHIKNGVVFDVVGLSLKPFNPSTNWAQGGPIMEREGISPLHFEGLWYAFHDFPTHDCIDDIADGYVGPTPLIAAMRCYVASKLGDEVEIPDGLKGE